ncbi:MAG: TIGR03564 family F420-dependent LLM class oxidoreductase [Dehalococcoidia bacterium]|nr:TIGR03564 family F420-dependent LLM class oxidoreductase [Dehalococcoidia bacterium]
MRIGIFIDGNGPVEKLIGHIKQAEADGFASAWVPNIFSYDGIMMMALAGRETSTIELGTFVVPTYPRHPLALAQSALTASAAADGRFTLGIGLSHKMIIEGMFGLDFSKPVRHMREYLSVLMPLMRGEQVAFTGEEYRVNGAISIPAKPPTTLIAALGPQMLRVAGRLADGTATWMGGPKYLGQTAVPTIRAAAAEAGRPEPRIVSGFPIALTSSVESARETAAKVFQVYTNIPSYRAVMDIEGAEGPAQIALAGDETSLRAQLRQLAEAGVTDINASVFPVTGDPEARERTRTFLAHIAKNGL